MVAGRFPILHLILDKGGDITFHAEIAALATHVMVWGVRARLLMWLARLLAVRSHSPRAARLTGSMLGMEQGGCHATSQSGPTQGDVGRRRG